MPDTAKSRAKRKAYAALCIAAGLPLSGCFFKQKPLRTFVPPPPVAARIPPEYQVLNLPEPSEDFSPDVEYTKIVTVVSLPAAPAKPAPSKPASAAKIPPATAEPVVNPPATATTTPGPKPQTIYSATDRQQMTQELNVILDRVKKILDKAGGKNLPSDLASLANNAKNWAEQAEQARERDLQTAVSNAKRAEFFANDLNSRIP